MVGLSIVLESFKNTNNKKNPQVINKATMIKPSPPPCRWNSPPPIPAAGFLDRCFLCHQKLLPGKDIYMYKGDRAFCSVECRCKQILMDEEETNSSTGNFKRENCSLAAIKAPKPSSHSSSSSSSSSRRNQKAGVNRDGANGFAY